MIDGHPRLKVPHDQDIVVVGCSGALSYTTLTPKRSSRNS